ncbi:hypothetical protein QUA41_31300 [Microcoleus sp. Pol11C1]|uniref:hypothetical protein n=1 Tax=unclassified Microcoleus TaxID=2642155 RepID=UPI002FD5C4DF
MANHGLSRRQFLACAIALSAIIPSASKIVGIAIGATEPEFWFGELVDFVWTDETTGKVQSETGQVIGVNWDFTTEEWEYRIMWLSSTAYPDDYYPMCDGQLITAGEISKH